MSSVWCMSERIGKVSHSLLRFTLQLYAICFSFLQTAEHLSRPSVVDPEKAWLEKLFDECEDEFCETFGVYDGKFRLII